MSDFQTSFNPVPLPMGPRGPNIQQYLNADGAAGGAGDMEKAAKDFESVLLHQLLQEMSRTIPESGLTSSGASKQIQSIFWSFLAEEVADNGGLGLWRDIQQYCTGAPKNDPPAPTVEQEL
jgi:Rod binding domain-containing protein